MARYRGPVGLIVAAFAAAVFAAPLPAHALSEPEAEILPQPVPEPEQPSVDIPGVEEAPVGSRVEALLDDLAVADSESGAKQLEQRILRAWHQSGSPTVDLLIRRATSAINDKQYALALEYLDTIVELAPDFAEGWNKRATVYYLIDEYQRSITDIGRVLSLEPRHFGALSGLGMIFRELNDKSRALSVFRRTLEVHPYFGDVRSAVDRLEIEVEGRGI